MYIYIYIYIMITYIIIYKLRFAQASGSPATAPRAAEWHRQSRR